MGTPLGPALANALLVHFGKNWLQNCPSDCKPYYYRRWLLILFTSPQHLEAFRNFPNGQHANMSFTIESDKQNRMSFLDVQIIREEKKFTISVYWKITFIGVHTHFDSLN